MVPERDEVAEAAQEALRYALSHDLRAPLRVIDGFARILKEDHAAALDKLGRDHVERILAAAQRMNGMIDAVLDQAHLSQAPLQRADVDLSALARDVAGELIACRPPLADGSLPPDVRLEVAEGMCSPADAMLVRRVFENLIGNAIKYSQKVAAPHITIGAVPHTDPEVYFVRDNGAGFDMKHADKLFGLFQRLHSTREFPGSGVGLASVNNIIRRHGGRVWAEAAPGEGACFYFSLAPFKSGTTRR
jgi:light-regulated signal transduction histidine kinase (bacteriophytochrome)